MEDVLGGPPRAVSIRCWGAFDAIGSRVPGDNAPAGFTDDVKKGSEALLTEVLGTLVNCSTLEIVRIRYPQRSVSESMYLESMLVLVSVSDNGSSSSW
jgi:hypothetical protein